jgi:cytochrome c553
MPMAAILLLKVLGLVLGSAGLVIGLAAGAVYFVSDNRLNLKVDVPPESIAIPTDITAIQRGQHLASAVAACVECHGPNLAGKVYLDDPLLVRIVPPNLTRGRGGVGATFTDADFVRAIRHGVDPSGRQLLIMPSDDYNHFSDADLGAIVAYVRALPSINTSLPANDIHTFGLILFAIGRLPLQPAANIDHLAPRPVAPAAEVSAEYGKYLSDTAGCPSCHGPGLSGGQVPQAQANAVPAANITPAALVAWSEIDFIKAMRTGVRPDGHSIATSMPWPFYAQLTDSELQAIWRFLRAVPPRQTGTR